MTTQALAWCFTLNNPDEDEVLVPQSWDPEEYKYLVYQLEEGAEGTRHLQGYISLEKRIRFAAFKKWFPGERAHIEVAKGSAKQNQAYCTKAEGRVAGPWEFGSLPEPGKRSDLLEIKEKLDQGATLKEISENDKHFMNFCRYSKAFKEYKLLHTERRDWPMDIEVVWGATGTGKSRYCQENYPGAYWKSKNSGTQQFWDGYEGEQVIIIDEFYGWLSWDYLLRLTDRYPFSLDIKHGTIQLSARKIVFTSNKHPSEWYPNSKYLWDERNPLKRRLTVVRELGVDGVRGTESPAGRPVDGSSTGDQSEESRLINLYMQ